MTEEQTMTFKLEAFKLAIQIVDTIYDTTNVVERHDLVDGDPYKKYYKLVCEEINLI